MCTKLSHQSFVLATSVNATFERDSSLKVRSREMKILFNRGIDLLDCINEEQHLIEFVRNYSKLYDFSRTKGNSGWRKKLGNFGTE